ncbi:MAG: ATP synthase F1 subunit epsilon [Clostridiales bacterium]|nr:ATP synthase F1 subunit epsilon [Clostridiales bacterium]
MDKSFKLDIVTPDKKFFGDMAEMIVINTSLGKIGVMKNHIPMVFAVMAGIIKIRKDGVDRKAFVGEGFMEVGRNSVTLMVDAAEWPEDIDLRRAQKAKERAEENLRRELAHKEYMRNKAALLRAIERIKITKKSI